MPYTISTDQQCFRAHQAHSSIQCPSGEGLSRPGWAKAATEEQARTELSLCVLLHSAAWCNLRRKTSDPQFQTLTGSSWPCDDAPAGHLCSDDEQCTFWGCIWHEEAPSQGHTFHTHKTATILELNNFIWHKIQYSCGNSKHRRQKKEKTIVLSNL